MRAAIAILTLLAATAAAQDDVDDGIGALIDAGDPAAVPVIRAKLARASAGSVETDPAALNALLEAAQEASMYGLDEAGPALVRAYRAMPPQATYYLSNIARSASQYRTPEAVRFQQTLLADPRLKADQDRVPLLAALADSGDAQAIDSLARLVEAQLARLATSGATSGAVTTIAPLVRSQAFRDRVAAIEPPAGEAAQQALATLRERLDRNARSAGELMDDIESAPAAETRRVGDALLALGRIGAAGDIARLSTLRLGAGDALKENDRLVAWRDDAIAAIRRRHWRDATSRPVTPAAD